MGMPRVSLRRPGSARRPPPAELHRRCRTV